MMTCLKCGAVILPKQLLRAYAGRFTASHTSALVCSQCIIPGCCALCGRQQPACKRNAVICSSCYQKRRPPRKGNGTRPQPYIQIPEPIRSQAEVARMMGLSRSMIQQIEQSALRKLCRS